MPTHGSPEKESGMIKMSSRTFLRTVTLPRRSSPTLCDIWVRSAPFLVIYVRIEPAMTDIATRDPDPSFCGERVIRYHSRHRSSEPSNPVYVRLETREQVSECLALQKPVYSSQLEPCL